MQEKIEKGKERILFLDSARGLAAISVMIWHFLVMFFSREDKNLLLRPVHLFYYGEANVIFFFIHSGFILSYSYIDKFKNFSFLFVLQFLVERIFRIIPLFIFVLSVSYLAYLLFPLSNHSMLSSHGNEIWRFKVGVIDFLQQMNLFIQTATQADKRLVPQDWTLTVELVAGISIPVFLGLLKANKKLLGLIILIFSVKFVNTFIFEFGCGFLLFVFRKEISEFYNGLTMVSKGLTLILALYFYSCLFKFGSLFSEENIAFSYSIDRVIVVIGCLLIFSVLISSVKIQKLLANSLLVLTGKICYSLYLWHMLWLILFSGITYQFFKISLALPSIPSLLATFICFFGCTFLLSYFSFLFIEVPFNKLGKRVAKYISNISIPLKFFTLIK